MHRQNDHIGFHVCRLSKLIKREIDNKVPAEIAGNATAINRWVLAYLYDNDGRDIFQKDIEKLFSIRRSTASNMLQLMEQKGLIARLAVEGDARLKKLVLTERGREVFLCGVAVRDEIDRQLVDGISAEELEVCRRTLEKMRINILGDDGE